MPLGCSLLYHHIPGDRPSPKMKHQSPAIAAGHLLVLLLLFASTFPSTSQPSPPASGDNKTNNSNDNNPYGFSPNFNPSMAIIIVVLIAAFFFLGFFSIYIRQCSEADPAPTTILGAAAARSRRKGIDPELLSTFPTLVYSEVKSLKIGKHALECAVCLSEFEDSDSLRLLPRCSHVFHPDCIDEWLTSHVTCPVCRSDLTDVTPAESAAADAAAHVTIIVEDRGSEEVKEDMAELSRIASKRRRLPRSHSTGHSLNIVHAGDHDRFTLRLPEDVRKEIVAAGRLRRGESLRGVRVTGGEGSSRGRSIRLGRSGRWSSFKNLSVRVPAWAARRWDGEGSARKGDGSVKAGGDGSARGRRVQFDCLGGGGGGGGDSVKSAECRV